MGEKFEEIEQQQFGGDGFEKAVQQISDIETDSALQILRSLLRPRRRKYNGVKFSSSKLCAETREPFSHAEPVANSLFVPQAGCHRLWRACRPHRHDA